MRWIRAWRVSIGLAIVVVAVISGCGVRAADRCEVRGAVTLNGTPIDGGNIQFEPLGKSKTTFSGALIQQGRYEIPARKGLAPGSYRVRIYWPEKLDPRMLKAPVPGQQLSPEEAPRAKEQVPAKFNRDSELTVEVEQDGANAFDFALST